MTKNIAQLYADSSYSVRRADEHHAVGVRVFSKSARTRNKIGQAVGLCLERVATGESYLARDRRGTLQLPVWLAHDQYVVVRLHDNFWIGSCGRGQSGGTEILSIRCAFKKIARVQWNSKSGR